MLMASISTMACDPKSGSDTYWLNVKQLAHLMLKPGQTLEGTKYFTTIVKHPRDKNRRQAVFLEALGTLGDFYIYYGHFLSNTYMCWQCGHTHVVHHEKMTDVKIATELLSDAFQDKFDSALLYSADSDLVGPIETVKHLFPKKRIVVAFPPGRSSAALKRAATAYTNVSRSVLSKSVFPDQVTKPDGYVLHRPKEWR